MTLHPLSTLTTEAIAALPAGEAREPMPDAPGFSGAPASGWRLRKSRRLFSAPSVQH